MKQSSGVTGKPFAFSHARLVACSRAEGMIQSDAPGRFSSSPSSRPRNSRSPEIRGRVWPVRIFQRITMKALSVMAKSLFSSASRYSACVGRLVSAGAAGTTTKWPLHRPSSSGMSPTKKLMPRIR
jgi:hypothetical protein